MSPSIPPQEAPELVFGLVAPVGVDLELVIQILSQALREVAYDVHEFRLTALMREVPIELPLDDAPYIRSIRDRIAYANAVRAKLGKEAMAALAISAIRSLRSDLRYGQAAGDSESVDGWGETPEERPIPRQAYVLRQLKRPEEVGYLRSVYGKQFILLSAYASEDSRLKRIEDRERDSRGGLIDPVKLHGDAYSLISLDAREVQDENGQNVRDAFPLGDVFIDTTTRVTCSETIHRFIRLLFGDNEISPTHEEYGMYVAKCASLRSSDLSRQVGAAIFRNTGEVVSLGCNEVPRAGGGTYWTGDPLDRRDFVQGHDPNERIKTELVVDILDRLKSGGHLSERHASKDDAYLILKSLLEDNDGRSLRHSRVMDLLEFGRIIHAEMSAISDAARLGLAIHGAILYCTTFPCHICAKHIVASGISRVVYLEPYPKSYASELHSDAIQVDTHDSQTKVAFETFIGVSPFRYRDLFEKGRRKYSGGTAAKWHGGEPRPMIDVYYPSYFRAETHVVGYLKDRLSRAAEPKDQTAEDRERSA